MANEKGGPVTSKSSSLKEMKMIVGLPACGHSPTAKPRIIIPMVKLFCMLQSYGFYMGLFLCVCVFF